MSSVTVPDLRIAHEFIHVDRVRRWALQIARSEGYEDLALVEAAALLHDVGLAHVQQGNQHGQAGAEVAARFLRQEGWFTDQEIETIAEAIRCHNSPRGGGMLATILRDADILDALGAIGLMRAFTSKYMKPEYDPRNVKGDTWGTTAREYDERFATGKGVGAYLVDQVNFQIGFYGNLSTRTAKRLAEPLVEFMQAFLLQLESEVSVGRNRK
jgi:uncharacterized protein